MAVIIRDAVRADVPLIHEFIRALAVFEKLEHAHIGTEADLEATLFDNQFAHVVFARDTETNEDVGFALYYLTYSTFLSRPGIHLEDLFVKEECRGKGVGLALLKHVAAVAVARGFGRLEWAALDWNTPAINFYTGKSVRASEMTEWKLFRLTGDELAQFAAPRLAAETN